MRRRGSIREFVSHFIVLAIFATFLYFINDLLTSRPELSDINWLRNIFYLALAVFAVMFLIFLRQVFSIMLSSVMIRVAPTVYAGCHGCVVSNCPANTFIPRKTGRNRLRILSSFTLTKIIRLFEAIISITSSSASKTA